MKGKLVKKFMSAALAGVMTASLLAGCGGSGDSSSDENSSGGVQALNPKRRRMIPLTTAA